MRPGGRMVAASPEAAALALEEPRPRGAQMAQASVAHCRPAPARQCASGEYQCSLERSADWAFQREAPQAAVRATRQPRSADSVRRAAGLESLDWVG